MFTFLYRLYYLRFQSASLDNSYLRIMTRLLNCIFPVFFRIMFWDNSISHIIKKPNRNLNIVSLTSFPARINKVWLTIETILRQKEKPDKILLWLYKGEFNDKRLLPRSLKRLEKRGLEICFCDENLMPHKKYYYSMLKYPEANVIIIDDDVLYPPDLISKLKYYSNLYPNTIICPIAMKIEVTNGKIQPYGNWNYIYQNSQPSLSSLMIGAGSVYYPAQSLHYEVHNKYLLKKLALSADDLWLKVMSIKKNSKVVCIAGEYKRFFIPVKIKNNINLTDINIKGGQNDIILNKLINYYRIPLSVFSE